MCVTFSRNENMRVRRQIQLNTLLTGMRIKFAPASFAVQGVIHCTKGHRRHLTSSWGGGCHRMLSAGAAFRSDHRESSQMMLQTTSNKLSGGRERFRINSFGRLPGISPTSPFSPLVDVRPFYSPEPNPTRASQDRHLPTVRVSPSKTLNT